MRRVNYRRRIYVCVVVFVAIFSFVALRRLGGSEVEVEAADLTKFDSGYIMSDYQMSNYNSMTEAEIQSWLTSKNSCPNTDYNLYLRLSASTSVATWHFANGHFVCISEELFGDGEVIGTGETAAHIIWQAAQDYHINPQVLLVLLQKENSLITDDLPNSWNYRTATGYGCPDTAACSSKYYGFKNQIRNAAALFHEVLSGGWTNYPLGENWVRFSPHCDSGTVVNIRSLATSALYRYTPYQPNAAALSVGYGTVPGSSYETCAAYGNRNFYSFFEDWFGGITMESSYSEVDTPRYMKVKNDTYYINPKNGEQTLLVKGGTVLKFTTKIKTSDNSSWCIRTESDTKQNINRCILRAYLDELEYSMVDNARYMITKKDTYFINPKTLEKGELVKRGSVFMFTMKILDSNGVWCIRDVDNTEANKDVCLERSDLNETNNYLNSAVPRYMKVSTDAAYITPHTLKEGDEIKSGQVYLFNTKILDSNGNWCLRTREDTENGVNRCVSRSLLEEVSNFVKSAAPRKMKVVRDTHYIMPYTMEDLGEVKKGEVFKFTTKVLDLNGNWCIRTEEDTKSDTMRCIARDDLVNY